MFREGGKINSSYHAEFYSFYSYSFTHSSSPFSKANMEVSRIEPGENYTNHLSLISLLDMMNLD